MTTQSRPLPAPRNHTLHLAPRQLQVMRIFWIHGAGTVQDLRRWLVSDPTLAYTTLMSVCVRLYEKGLLDRRKLNQGAGTRGIPYLYLPMLSEAEYARRTIGLSIEQYVNRSDVDVPNQPDRVANAHQLAELSGVDGQPTILRLLERAEAAEHAAAQAAVALYEATERVAALERRTEAAERRAETALRRVEQLERQLNKPPTPARTKRAPLGISVEHHDQTGICRVCAQPAPPAHSLRQDGLRACLTEACRLEARRRDNAIKQRRYHARRKDRSAA